VARAEPVAALYEQDRVTHRPGLGMLEAEMGSISLKSSPLIEGQAADSILFMSGRISHDGT